MTRRYVEEQHMSRRRWVLGGLGGAVGVAATGAAIGLLRQQRAISRRAGDDVTLGTLALRTADRRR